ATAALNASDIAQPLRSVLRKASNVTVLLAEVRSVELRKRRLALDWGTLTYDALILAVGASHSYFHHHEWEVLAPGLKTLEDALAAAGGAGHVSGASGRRGGLGSAPCSPGGSGGGAPPGGSGGGRGRRYPPRRSPVTPGVLIRRGPGSFPPRGPAGSCTASPP